MLFNYLRIMYVHEKYEAIQNVKAWSHKNIRGLGMSTDLPDICEVASIGNELEASLEAGILRGSAAPFFP